MHTSGDFRASPPRAPGVGRMGIVQPCHRAHSHRARSIIRGGRGRDMDAYMCVFTLYIYVLINYHCAKLFNYYFFLAYNERRN